MKKVLLAVMAILVMSGCTAGMVEFMDTASPDGQHEKALSFLGADKGTVIYKDSEKAKECKRAKLVNRGYWMMQDEIDCFDNEVR